MSPLFQRLFTRGAAPPPHRRVYAEIVAQARQEALYTALEVPDTLEGRYEMVMLHAFLLMERLKQGGEEESALAQAVFDDMFMDMDHNLREIGIADVRVGKHIRRMAEMFYGRVEAYGEALKEPEEARALERLQAALDRNVHPGSEDPHPVGGLARYVLRQRHALAEQPLAAILDGKAGFAAEVELS